MKIFHGLILRKAHEIYVLTHFFTIKLFNHLQSLTIHHFLQLLILLCSIVSSTKIHSISFKNEGGRLTWNGMELGWEKNKNKIKNKS